MDISTFPYFIWCGTDSRTKGIWVAQYPDKVRATERVKAVIVPGREGVLTQTEGEAVYESLPVQVKVQALKTANFRNIQDWLRGSGLVVFGNESSKAYYGRVTEQVDFTPYSKDIYEAIINFTCNPLARLYPAETAVTLTQAGSVTNSGNVVSKPLIELTTSTDCTLTVGSNTLSITGKTGSITIDSDAEMITRTYTEDNVGITENILQYTSGDFPKLAVGANAISWTGTITQAKVTVNARWV